MIDKIKNLSHAVNLFGQINVRLIWVTHTNLASGVFAGFDKVVTDKHSQSFQPERGKGPGPEA